MPLIKILVRGEPNSPELSKELLSSENEQFSTKIKLWLWVSILLTRKISFLFFGDILPQMTPRIFREAYATQKFSLDTII